MFVVTLTHRTVSTSIRTTSKMIFVFGGFIVHQMYRFTPIGGIGLLALTVFDLIVIWVTWLEYRAVRSRPE